VYTQHTGKYVILASGSNFCKPLGLFGLVAKDTHYDGKKGETYRVDFYPEDGDDTFLRKEGNNM
jgi:hypothetical protein